MTEATLARSRTATPTLCEPEDDASGARSAIRTVDDRLRRRRRRQRTGGAGPVRSCGRRAPQRDRRSRTRIEAAPRTLLVLVTAVSAEQLDRWVRAGELRYVLSGSGPDRMTGGGQGTTRSRTTWINRTCTAVPAAEYVVPARSRHRQMPEHVGACRGHGVTSERGSVASWVVAHWKPCATTHTFLLPRARRTMP